MSKQHTHTTSLDGRHLSVANGEIIFELKTDITGIKMKDCEQRPEYEQLTKMSVLVDWFQKLYISWKNGSFLQT